MTLMQHTEHQCSICGERFATAPALDVERWTEAIRRAVLRLDGYEWPGLAENIFAEYAALSTGDET